VDFDQKNHVVSCEDASESALLVECAREAPGLLRAEVGVTNVMEKERTFVAFAVVFALSFMLWGQVNGDIVPPRPEGDSGISVWTVVLAGVAVAAIVVVSYFVLRKIRRGYGKDVDE
jgi:hypothetical protein